MVAMLQYHGNHYTLHNPVDTSEEVLSLYLRAISQSSLHFGEQMISWGGFDKPPLTKCDLWVLMSDVNATGWDRLYSL